MSALLGGGGGSSSGSLVPGTTPIAPSTDKAVLFDNAGFLGEDADFTWDTSAKQMAAVGRAFVGTSTQIVLTGYVGPTFEVLGEAADEITVAILGQHPFGTNLSFVPDHSTVTDFFNIWSTPRGFYGPGTLFDGLLVFGINDFPDGRSPIVIDSNNIVYMTKIGWSLDSGFTTVDGYLSSLGTFGNSRLIWEGNGSSTNATSLELDATPGGGHKIQWQSTGSANGLGAGRLAVYDETADVPAHGSVYIVLDENTHGLLSQQVLTWNSNNQYQTGSYDTGLSRISANIVGIGNGTQGDTSGTLELAELNIAAGRLDIKDVAATTTLTSNSNVDWIVNNTNIITFSMRPATGGTPIFWTMPTGAIFQVAEFSVLGASDMLFQGYSAGGLGYTMVEDVSGLGLALGTALTASPVLITVNRALTAQFDAPGCLTLAPTVVGSLPAGTVGQEAVVTDALAPVVGATVVGGGAVNAKVWFNGAAWKVFAL